MVDVVTGIVGILAAGATAALKDTVSQAVKETYAAVKDLLKTKVTSLPNFEEDPTDEDYRKAMAKEFLKKRLADDPEILNKIRDLTRALEKESQGQLAAWGIDIQQIRAADNIIIADVESSSTTRIKDLEAKSGDVRLERIKTGGKEKN